MWEKCDDWWYEKDLGNAMNELKPVDVLYASNYVSIKWKSQIKCCVNNTW